ncbi:hypothetical protein ACFLQJ_01035 [Calditrichota bacterium]
MINFKRSPEPDDFDSEVRKPGNKWLEENLNSPENKRPRPYWNEYEHKYVIKLKHAFKNLCAYSCMFLHDGQVDHFISVKLDKSKIYEWDNYRYATGWINGKKLNLTGFLDPFEVQDGWFEVHIPSLQLIITDSIPHNFRAKAENTIQKLGLQKDKRIIDQRENHLKSYLEKKISFEALMEYAPLVAHAIRKLDKQTLDELRNNYIKFQK